MKPLDASLGPCEAPRAFTKALQDSQSPPKVTQRLPKFVSYLISENNTVLDVK